MFRTPSEIMGRYLEQMQPQVSNNPIQITPALDSKIKRPLAKIGNYWTFIGKEAQQAIQEYLRMRGKFGQQVGPDSPLFENFHQRGKHIDISAWGDIVRGLCE
jgi:hypothetical protein